MKIHYDRDVDAVYIELSDERPEAASEIENGVHVDLTPGGKIVGIEVLDASKRMDLSTLLSYQIDFDRKALFG